jgi:hypothetical protein
VYKSDPQKREVLATDRNTRVAGRQRVDETTGIDEVTWKSRKQSKSRCRPWGMCV